VIISPCVFALPKQKRICQTPNKKARVRERKLEKSLQEKGRGKWKVGGKTGGGKKCHRANTPFPHPHSLPHPPIQSNFLQVADIKAILYLAKCHRRLKNTQTQRGIGSWRGVGKTIKISL